MFRNRHIIPAVILVMSIIAGTSCNIVKTKTERPLLLATKDASQDQLMTEIDRMAKVESIRAKLNLQFEDNSFAEFGMAEKYRKAPGEILLQRPANIRLKVQLPAFGTDIAQMTSNGEKFRVAILEDGSGGKYKKFVVGSNMVDYSPLQTDFKKQDNADKTIKENVNAFSNIRPQHFVDAMLVRPTDKKFSYLQSTIFVEEEDQTDNKKSTIRRLMRGYYLLDELEKSDSGALTVKRRFWFDRVGTVRLARQQTFDAHGEIESDITYGKEGSLGDRGQLQGIPLEILVIRPKEKYSMRLTYAAPAAANIGIEFTKEAFALENSWNLPLVDLDVKLAEVKAGGANGNLF